MISPGEDARLDELTVRNTARLETIAGADLDAVLADLHRRHGQPDSAFRARALANTHPDDLAAALAALT